MVVDVQDNSYGAYHCYNQIMKIIGITGPAGSGKDTASEYIAEQLGIKHSSGGDHLRRMLVSLGLEPKKTALGDFGTFLRIHYGADTVVRPTIELGGNDTAVIHSGLRSPSEAQVILNMDGVLIYVDAPRDIRHALIQQRQRPGDIGHSRALKVLDKQEGSGITHTEEDLETVKSMATVIIDNSGTIENFKQQLDAVCTEIKTIL
jgi:dephospho-CoA kinase